MKGVFKENKELKYLKEEFNTFLKKRKVSSTEKKEKVITKKIETTILEEVEL